MISIVETENYVEIYIVYYKKLNEENFKKEIKIN